MSKPLVLDGALGTLLPQESQDHPLWSTHCLIESPHVISQIHKSYIENGSDVIQTSTYQLDEGSLKKYYPETSYRQILTKSIDLVFEQAQTSEKQVQIAGSVGPYGASLSNGAEYTGDYNGISYEGLQKFHEIRLDVLSRDKRVDIIAFETIPNLLEIQVLIDSIGKYNKKYYISLSVKDQVLADGSDLKEIFKVLEKVKHDDKLIGVGVNCLSLIDSLKWLKLLKPIGKPLVVYPNSGEIYDGELRKFIQNSNVSTQLTWKDYVKRVIGTGDIYLIGGCCRTTPQIISQIRQTVDELYN